MSFYTVMQPAMLQLVHKVVARCSAISFFVSHSWLFLRSSWWTNTPTSSPSKAIILLYPARMIEPGNCQNFANVVVFLRGHYLHVCGNWHPAATRYFCPVTLAVWQVDIETAENSAKRLCVVETNGKKTLRYFYLVLFYNLKKRCIRCGVTVRLILICIHRSGILIIKLSCEINSCCP